MGIKAWASSKLPSWVKRQPSMSPAMRKELQAEYQIPIRDSFNTVRGWRDLGISYEIAIPGSDPYKAPGVTRAIQVFDPQMIPMTIRWTFLSPADGEQPKQETFVRHAVGRYLPNPHYHHEPFPCAAPATYVGPMPNQIDLVWSGELFGRFDPRGRDLPGDYLPWDQRLVDFMAQAFQWHKNHTIAEMKKHFIYDPLEKAAKRSEQNRKEQQYINADLRAYVTKMLSKLGEGELRDYFMGGKFQRKPRKAQIVIPGGVPQETPRPKQPTLPGTLYGQGVISSPETK